MSTAILRPISNILTSWASSNYANIDDVITNPTIGGTGDYNSANKNDSNEVEKFRVQNISGLISAVTINLLATAYDSSPSNLTLTGNYSLKGSSGVSKSFTVPSTTGFPPTGWTWYSWTWSGLAIAMQLSDSAEIWIGVGAMSNPKYLYVAVGYLSVEYVISRYLGGVWLGGVIT